MRYGKVLLGVFVLAGSLLLAPTLFAKSAPTQGGFEIYFPLIARQVLNLSDLGTWVVPDEVYAIGDVMNYSSSTTFSVTLRVQLTSNLTTTYTSTLQTSLPATLPGEANPFLIDLDHGNAEVSGLEIAEAVIIPTGTYLPLTILTRAWEPCYGLWSQISGTLRNDNPVAVGDIKGEIWRLDIPASSPIIQLGDPDGTLLPGEETTYLSSYSFGCFIPDNELPAYKIAVQGVALP